MLPPSPGKALLEETSPAALVISGQAGCTRLLPHPEPDGTLAPASLDEHYQGVLGKCLTRSTSSGNPCFPHPFFQQPHQPFPLCTSCVSLASSGSTVASENLKLKRGPGPAVHPDPTFPAAVSSEVFRLSENHRPAWALCFHFPKLSQTFLPYEG